MEMRGSTVEFGTIQSVILDVSARNYNGNVIPSINCSPIKNGGRITLSVLDSHGPGSRTSASGRHGPYACWHAHRDVLAAFFNVYPYAKVRTALAVYDGRIGFLDTFPKTGDINIGSQVNPVKMKNTCDCR